MHQALAPYRLGPQLLVDSDVTRPRDVVRHFGAVQAQEHTTAPWSVGRRCGAVSGRDGGSDAPTAETVTSDLESGGIQRLHVLRPTWHWVHLDDLPHVLAATSDRVMRLVEGHVSRLGTTADELARLGEVATAAVRDQPGCTRADVASRLAEAGHPVEGDRLAHVLVACELRGEVAGRRGPGEPHRYHPLDLPRWPDTDEARAWLARTYVRGHGPVSAHDLAWWSSLTLTQARAALAAAGLEPVTIADRELWAEHPVPVLDERRVEVPDVLLLANLDELISHRRDDAFKRESGALHDQLIWGFGLLALDGRLVGHWNRTLHRDRIDLTVTTPGSLSRRHRVALEREVESFGAFWALPATLSVTA